MRKMVCLAFATLSALAPWAAAQESPAKAAGAPQAAAKPGPAARPEAAAKPEALLDRVSYAIGLNLGANFKEDAIEVNIAQLVKGITDGLAGAQALLTEEEIQATMQEFQQAMTSRQKELQTGQGEANKKKGEAFLAENKKRQGVVTLPSGLQYEVIEAGAGAIPKADDEVTVHYRGTLIDGKEFDSSYGRGEPATFPANKVIPGWVEALQLMKVGSKWKLYVPAELAYADKGAGNAIGPNETLIFEVNLIGIKGK